MHISLCGIYAECIEGGGGAMKKPVEGPDPRGPESEAAFLAGYDVAVFPRPSVAVDVVVLTAVGGALRVALYLRREHPSKGRHALPGGFVRMDESLDDAAARLLRDKAGLTSVFIEQLYTFGAPGRDPRGRVIAVAYYALVDPRRFDEISEAKGARSAAIHVPWEGETGGPVEARGDAGEPIALAFDHAEIVGMAVKRLRGRLDYSPIGFQLLPAEFTLRALQDVHEAVRGAAVNKDSFRRRLLAGGLLEATGAYERDTAHRPAELFRFNQKAAP
jgi:8-oxo-dGTP diphosphatase